MTYDLRTENELMKCRPICKATLIGGFDLDGHTSFQLLVRNILIDQKYVVDEQTQ